MKSAQTSYTMQLNTHCHTDADGFWTHAKRNVLVTELELIVHVVNPAVTYGELRVHYDDGTWNSSTDGLIFSDRNFLHELKSELLKRGMKHAEFLAYGDKSEQGSTFVQMDCDPAFIEEFKKLSAA